MSEHEGNRITRLTKLAEEVPPQHIATVRELVQKECEVDGRSQQTLVERANIMMAAAGVGIALLVGFSKEGSVDTCTEKTFLIIALVLAVLCAAIVLFSIKVFEAPIVMPNETLFAAHVPRTIKEEAAFARHHECQVAVAYAEIRIGLEAAHHTRATRLLWAQVCFFLYLIAAGCFALSIPL
jgi:hypothetical protein